MSAHPTTLETVSRLLGDLIREDISDPDLPLLDAGKLTSLTSMNLILAIEETFEIRIPNSELTRDNLSSLRTLAAMVERLKTPS